MNTYVGLTNMSLFSSPEAVSTPEAIVQAAAESSMPSVGLTDIGNLNGALRFFNAATKAGIKPIIGMSILLPTGNDRCQPRMFQRTRLNLLAMNASGLNSFGQLLRHSWNENYFYGPRVGKDTLQQSSSGLIALSGNLEGEIPTLIREARTTEVIVVANFYKQLFPGNFFLEIQRHGCLAESFVNQQLIDLGRTLGIPLVATQTMRVVSRSDVTKLEQAISGKTGSDIVSSHDRSWLGDDYLFQPPREMAERFQDMPKALANTIEIARRCKRQRREMVAGLSNLSLALSKQKNLKTKEFV